MQQSVASSTSKNETTNSPDKTETKTDNDTTVNDSKSVIKRAEPTLDTEIDFNLPDVDDDIRDVVKSIKKDRNKLKKVLTNGKLMIEDLILFKDKLEDITGTLMDTFVKYMSEVHFRHKDKFSITWNELYKVMLHDWPQWEYEYRNTEKVDDWIYDGEDVYHPLDDEGRIFDDDLQIEVEGYKERGRYMLKMKLEKHTEKINDIFKAYCFNMPKSDSDSDDFTTTRKSMGVSRTKIGDKSDFLSRTEAQNTAQKDESKSEVESKTEHDGKTSVNDKTEVDATTSNDGKTSHDGKTSIADKTSNDGKTSNNGETSPSATSKATKIKEPGVNKDSMITLHKNVEEDLDMMVPLVKVSKLSKVIKDLGYLCSIYFISKDEFQTGTFNPKKTNKAIVDKLLKTVWKNLHVSECIEKVQRGSAKSMGASILKSGGQKPGTSKSVSTVRKSEVEEPKTEKSATERPDTQQSGDSSSSDKTKKTTKTMKTEQTDGVTKTEKTSNSGDSSDSESKTTKTVKTVKTNAKSQFGKDKDEDLGPSGPRTIRFEDEAFKIERFDKSLDVNLFIDYMLEFYDNDLDVLFLIPQERHEGILSNIT